MCERGPDRWQILSASCRSSFIFSLTVKCQGEGAWEMLIGLTQKLRLPHSRRMPRRDVVMVRCYWLMGCDMCPPMWVSVSWSRHNGFAFLPCGFPAGIWGKFVCLERKSLLRLCALKCCKRLLWRHCDYQRSSALGGFAEPQHFNSSRL